MDNCNLSEFMEVGVECYRGVWIGLLATLFVGFCALCCFVGCYWERLLARLQKVLWRSHAQDNPDWSEVAMERRPDAVPPIIRIASPTNQVSCSGEYDLSPDERPNGQPLWKKRGGDRWLYSGDDGRWYVGGASSKDRRFACCSGFVYHNQVHGGTMPHELAGPWEWGGGAAWHKDPTIAVTMPSRALRRSASDFADERSAGVGTLPDTTALTLGKGITPGEPQAAAARGRGGRAGSRKGGRQSPSETSTEDNGAPASSFIDSSDTTSSSAHCHSGQDGMPPPVAMRPQTSPWRSPGRLVQILDEPGAEAAVEEPLPPRVLVVSSPNGRSDCAGEYMLVERLRANGQPVWRQQNGEHWLYSGTTSRWCIGGHDVKDDNFNRSAGWISLTLAHTGLMPDKVRAQWQRWDSGQGKFVRDEGISIVEGLQSEIGAHI